MTSRVVLWRHGRTALNADGRLRGRLDPDLDDVGRAEAREAARVLATQGVVRIVSSPLARALQTATALSELTGVPAEVDERLADRDYRDVAGAVSADLVARYGSLDAVPGIESHSEVLDRATNALEDATLPDRGVIVLVSHDAVIGILLAELGADPSDIVLPTGSYSMLTCDNGHWRVESVGVTPSPSSRR